MELKIKTTPQKYFRQLLEILDFAPPFDDISNREKDLLAEILTYNWVYRNVPEDDRWSLILSSEVREKMRLKLGVSKEGLNNLYVVLRKKGILTFSGLNEKCKLTPATSLTIKFYNDAD